MMWEVSSGSVPGPYHVRNDVVNQDAMGFLRFDDCLALAAADGAGSLDLSHVGSALAVDVVLESLVESDPALSLPDRLEQAVIDARARLWRHPDRDRIGCTLAVALLTPQGYGAAVVGDAFVVLKHHDDSLVLVTNPKQGEYANQTKFLTSPDCDVQIVSGPETLAGAAVSSDGLEQVGIKNDEAFPGFWNMIFAWAANPNTFDVEAVFRRMDEEGRLEDDTTLVVAVPAGLMPT